jgi:hypothetical protein
MKQVIGRLMLVGMMGWAAAAGAQDMDQTARSQPQSAAPAAEVKKDTGTVLVTWPEGTKITAQALIYKYGEPDGVADDRLIWMDKGRWSRVTLFREGVTDDFPTTHTNVVENSIHYTVPLDKEGEILKFDSALTSDRTAGTLSVRSDSEQANILALNLADEISQGKRTVESARVFMRDTLRKAQAGKSSRYTERLLFAGVDRQNN